jgi:hypothetical protein
LVPWVLTRRQLRELVKRNEENEENTFPHTIKRPVPEGFFGIVRAYGFAKKLPI